jgi:hypothetical protein
MKEVYVGGACDTCAEKHEGRSHLEELALEGMIIFK